MDIDSPRFSEKKLFWFFRTTIEYLSKYWSIRRKSLALFHGRSWQEKVTFIETYSLTFRECLCIVSLLINLSKAFVRFCDTLSRCIWNLSVLCNKNEDRKYLDSRLKFRLIWLKTFLMLVQKFQTFFNLWKVSQTQ